MLIEYLLEKSLDRRRHHGQAHGLACAHHRPPDRQCVGAQRRGNACEVDEVGYEVEAAPPGWLKYSRRCLTVTMQGNLADERGRCRKDHARVNSRLNMDKGCRENMKERVQLHDVVLAWTGDDEADRHT
jgi:hypothetical protein